MERPWIEHDGTCCPLPKGTVVDIQRANGFIVLGYPVGHARANLDGSIRVVGPDHPKPPTCSSWIWASISEPWKHVRIVRYRLASDPDAEARRERYAALFDGLIKTAPLDLPVQPEKEPVASEARPRWAQ